MSVLNNATQTTLQTKVFDFALTELVRQHKNSFQPLWTVDSWVKFLIWMTLNCGLSGERESLELFANAIGSSLTKRMRKVFFERVLDDLSLHILADPAETQVLVMPLSNGKLIQNNEIEQAFHKIALSQKVVLDKSLWQRHESIITIPWNLKK